MGSYKAGEQEASYDGRCIDIWALGLILWACLWGGSPFQVITFALDMLQTRGSSLQVDPDSVAPIKASNSPNASSDMRVGRMG